MDGNLCMGEKASWMCDYARVGGCNEVCTRGKMRDGWGLKSRMRTGTAGWLVDGDEVSCAHMGEVSLCVEFM